MKNITIIILLFISTKSIVAQSLFVIPETVTLSTGVTAKNIVMEASVDKNGFSKPGIIRFSLRYWQSLDLKKANADEIHPVYINNHITNEPTQHIMPVNTGYINDCDVFFLLTDTVSLVSPFIVADIYTFALKRLAIELERKYNWHITQ